MEERTNLDLKNIRVRARGGRVGTRVLRLDLLLGLCNGGTHESLPEDRGEYQDYFLKQMNTSLVRKGANCLRKDRAPETTVL